MFTKMVLPIGEKALKELRNDLIDELERTVNSAKHEKRNISVSEQKRGEEIRKYIKEEIDPQLEAENRNRGEMITVKLDQTVEQRQLDDAAFLTLVKEARATGGMTAGSNGVVIPVSIAQRIVEVAKNVSPLVAKATIWNVSGDLVLPSYDYTQNVFQYVTEGTAVTDSNGAFAGKTLSNFIIGSLTKISNSLINRADVDVVPVIIRQIGLSLALFLEGELINETGAKLEGLKSGVTVTATSTNTTTAVVDAKNVTDLIKLQISVPQVHQPKCEWLMHPNVWTSLRALTGASGNLLINGDDTGISADGGLTLFGKPVMLSDAMPATLALNARGIYYGDFSGLDIKLTTGIQVKVLLERYAAEYQTGITAFQELDSVVGDPSKFAVLVGK